MNGGRQTLRVRCAEPECTEIAFWDGMTVEDRRRQEGYLAERPWRCTRHQNAEEVLSVQNPVRSLTVTAERSRRYPELTKLFWREEAKHDVGSGFLYGPGFKAFADDFPEGTAIEITVRLVPAASPQTADSSG